MSEFYEVRNYRTAESLIYADLPRAVAELAQRDKQHNAWYLLRVSDGAFWEGSGFGRRIYTQAGDSVRLERAAKRALTVVAV